MGWFKEPNLEKLAFGRFYRKFSPLSLTHRFAEMERCFLPSINLETRNGMIK